MDNRLRDKLVRPGSRNARSPRHEGDEMLMRAAVDGAAVGGHPNGNGDGNGDGNGGGERPGPPVADASFARHVRPKIIRPVQVRPQSRVRQEPRSAEIRLADRLRKLRLDKNLTLNQLATAVGMSQAYLSRVENHRVSLTIAGLEKIAEALAVPMRVFFDQDRRNVPITFTAAGRGKPLRFRGPKGPAFAMLAAAKKGKLMEPLVTDLRCSEPIAVKSHSGEEFNYVLEGECLLIYGDDQIRLRQGDCVYYDASVPHAARAVKGSPCKLLAIVSSRDYLFHGDLSRLLRGNGE